MGVRTRISSSSAARDHYGSHLPVLVGNSLPRCNCSLCRESQGITGRPRVNYVSGQIVRYGHGFIFRPAARDPLFFGRGINNSPQVPHFLGRSRSFIHCCGAWTIHHFDDSYSEPAGRGFMGSIQSSSSQSVLGTVLFSPGQPTAEIFESPFPVPFQARILTRIIEIA